MPPTMSERSQLTAGGMESSRTKKEQAGRSGANRRLVEWKAAEQKKNKPVGAELTDGWWNGKQQNRKRTSLSERSQLTAGAMESSRTEKQQAGLSGAN